MISPPLPIPRAIGATLAPRPSDLGSYIPTLDGWRAVAILGVMIHHDAAQLFGPGGKLPWPWLQSLADLGQYGVQIFFGLSGLLICSRLLAERQEMGGISLRGFYARRFFRIMPPYWAYLAALSIIAAFKVLAISGWEFAGCLLFFRNYLPDAARGRDSAYTFHFWSLSVEEHFYLMWPCLLLILTRIGRPASGAFALGMAVTAWRAINAREGGGMLTVLGHPVGNFPRTDTRLDGLLFGCWIAALLADPGWRARLARWISPAAWSLIAILWLCAVYFARWAPISPLWIALLIPIVIAGTILHPGMPIGRLLEFAPIRWIGRLSYSLYLWQQLFLLRRPDRSPLGPLQDLPMNWLLAFACAIASHYLIERPAIRLGRAYLAHTSPVRPAIDPRSSARGGRRVFQECPQFPPS